MSKPDTYNPAPSKVRFSLPSVGGSVTNLKSRFSRQDGPLDLASVPAISVSRGIQGKENLLIVEEFIAAGDRLCAL
jgi:hypothetical protein